MKLKRTIVVGIGALLAMWFLWSLFGPHSRVKVGRRTTYLTEPLADDGLPNYLLALIERQREGVTVETNGAVPFWQGFGPYEMDKEQFRLLCEEIGLKSVDERSFLVRLDDDNFIESFSAWLDEREVPEAVSNGVGFSPVARMLGVAAVRPWRSVQLPPLAEWVDQNKAALDLFHIAAAKPRFYSPAPQAFQDPALELLAYPLGHAQAIRDATRALRVRAMQRLGQGEYSAALDDVEAALGLAAHLERDGQTMIEHLVAFGLRRRCRASLLAILDHGPLPEHVLARLAKTLESEADREPLGRLADAADFGGRVLHLDAVLRLTTGRLGGVNNNETLHPVLMRMAFDPTPALLGVNEHYDEFTAALRVLKRSERVAAIEACQQRVEAFGATPQPSDALKLIGRSSRSEWIGQMLLALMAPAIEPSVTACERDAAEADLLFTAAALAEYRTENGRYPDRLEKLAPGYVAGVPTDPFSEKPLSYRRLDDAYLLYSVGTNGRDDGGTNIDLPELDNAIAVTVNGEWHDRDELVESGEPPPTGDDLVIRLPLPPSPIPDEETE